MNQTQRASERLAARTAGRVEALWAQVATGVITLNQFRSYAAAVIVQANAAGVTIADLGLAADLTRNLGRVTPPLGVQPNSNQLDQTRVEAAIDTVLDMEPDEVSDLSESRRLRLAQVARSEPLLTVATTVTAGMVARNLPGWVRQVDADPCPKCIAWADGVVRPAGTPMRRHNGCACIQRPVPYSPGTQAARPAGQHEWTLWADSPVGQLISGIA